MSSDKMYDVVVVGGGPVGWAAAYEIAKAGKSVIVLEQNNFFNQAGSSNDMARMYRTMYVIGIFMVIVVECRPGTPKTLWPTWHTNRWRFGMNWRRTQVNRYGI